MALPPFPFETYLAARQQGDWQFPQALAQLGQSAAQLAGDIGQGSWELRKRRLVQQLSQLMSQQGQPMQGPQMPGAETSFPPPSGRGTFPPDLSGQMMGLMTQIYPEEAIKEKYKQILQQQDPLRQAQAEWYRRRLTQGPDPSKQTRSAFQDPASGTFYPAERPGTVELPLKPSQYGSVFAGQAKRKESMNRSIAIQKRSFDTANTDVSDAMKALDIFSQKYEETIAAKQAGPLRGMEGVVIGGLTRGSKFSKLAEFRRSKQLLVTALNKAVGINRFNLQEVQNMLSGLPTGTESIQVGRNVLRNVKQYMQSKLDRNKNDYESRVALIQGMMPSVSIPDVTDDSSGSTEDLLRALAESDGR